MADDAWISVRLAWLHDRGSRLGSDDKFDWLVGEQFCQRDGADHALFPSGCQVERRVVSEVWTITNQRDVKSFILPQVECELDACEPASDDDDSFFHDSCTVSVLPYLLKYYHNAYTYGSTRNRYTL
jgi:hypothetical protein